MRKIVVEFVLPKEDEDDYADTCAELVIEDFLGQKIGLRVISDSGATLTPTTPPSTLADEDK